MTTAASRPPPPAGERVRLFLTARIEGARRGDRQAPEHDQLQMAVEAGAEHERPADIRGDQHQCRIAAERERPPARERGHREPDEAHVRREQQAGGDDAQEVEPVVGEVARGRVGEERVADEQQEHRQQRQAEQRHQRGEKLPRDVGEAADRRRQIQREHVVAPIGTEQLGAQDRREDRDIEPDLGQVLAVRDELRKAVREALADDRADRQHGEGGEEGDQRQRDREELGAPALARAERAEGTPPRQ